MLDSNTLVYIFFPCFGSEEALREIARSLETQQSPSQHQKLLMAGILLPTQHTAVKSQGKKLTQCRKKAAGRTYLQFSIGKQRVVKLKAKLLK